MSDALLDEIRKSMNEMQEKMQSTYMGLETREVVGDFDGIIVKMTCTYDITDITIEPKAMQGTKDAFIHRLRQALKMAFEEVKKATQAQTMELMKQLQIPDDLRNLGLMKDDETEG